ncbi:hypothetical protein RRG08_019054 [Elysia crispata]|uniref:Uncharacterized protein n=1 Tax=Elysia crispata TaxID=231223 RepID=A0AAE1A5P4_9GAST|nr:hypothetical protein RRG08_019054 [Elysia crispata]
MDSGYLPQRSGHPVYSFAQGQVTLSTPSLRVRSPCLLLRSGSGHPVYSFAQGQVTLSTPSLRVRSPCLLPRSGSGHPVYSFAQGQVTLSTPSLRVRSPCLLLRSGSGHPVYSFAQGQVTLSTPSLRINKAEVSMTFLGYLLFGIKAEHPTRGCCEYQQNTGPFQRKAFLNTITGVDVHHRGRDYRNKLVAEWHGCQDAPISGRCHSGRQLDRQQGRMVHSDSSQQLL